MLYIFISFNRLLSQSLDCMAKLDKSCLNKEEFHMFRMLSIRLRQSRGWRYCLARERSCQCGGNTVLSLYSVMNPYIDIEQACR